MSIQNGSKIACNISKFSIFRAIFREKYSSEVSNLCQNMLRICGKIIFSSLTHPTSLTLPLGTNRN
jgi:hypothetical protein